MEILAAGTTATAGYYMNQSNQPIPKKKKRKIKKSSLPNGYDIYNQNGLKKAEENQKRFAESFYKKSQYPEKTNIIPNYYNALGPLLDKTKFNTQINFNKVPQLYQEQFDFDNNELFIPDTAHNEIFNNKVKNEKNITSLAQTRNRRLFQDIDKGNLIEEFSNLDSKGTDKNLLDVSEKLTDNSQSINRILKQGKAKKCRKYPSPYDDVKSRRRVGVDEHNEKILIDDETSKYPDTKEVSLRSANIPQFISQFDEQTFDNDNFPSATNDIHKKDYNLQERLSYEGGWSNYNDENTTYGVVSEKEFKHNNMMPFFKNKGGYGNNDLYNNGVKDRKTELFTGNLRTDWKKKEEVRPHFTPVADMSYMYGTPVRREVDDSRYIPSLYRQNEKLFNEIRVTPGLNLDYNEVGKQGYQDLYRAIPKTVDQLRVASNPKITYEGRIIEGMKGEERPVQAPVITYKPDGFKVTTEDDLLPTTDFNKGPKTVDKFIMKDTDRSHQHIEYTGGAYTSEAALGKNVPEYMREKVKSSTRQNFVLPKPLQKFGKDETKYNQNLNSYDNRNTIRAQTGNNEHYGALSKEGFSTYSSQQDLAKTTIRETEHGDQGGRTHIGGNTMRGIINIMDIAKTTTRETTENNNYISNNNEGMKMKLYYNDEAKQTLREMTTDTPVAPQNIIQSQLSYADYQDTAKNTTKETTVNIHRNNNMGPTTGQLQTVHHQDIAKNTTKETTIEQFRNNFIGPTNGYSGTVQPQDNARNTIKETTAGINRNNNIGITHGQMQTSHLQDIAKNTIKETTVGINRNNNIGITHGQVQTSHLQDIAKNTIKETTVGINRNTNIGPTNGYSSTLQLQDTARNTIKETTVGIQRNNNVSSTNGASLTNHYQDVAKNTTKETTVDINRNNFIGQTNGYFGTVQPQDSAKNTIKQTTEGIHRNTFVNPNNRADKSSSFNWDPLRKTTKETTIEIPYNTNVTGVTSQSGNASSFNRMPLRNTIKETTAVISRNTNITGVDKERGAADGFNRMPTRTTIKETTIDNNYIGAATNDVNAKGYGYLAENMEAHNTNRQFTGQEVYIAPLEGNIAQRGYSAEYNATFNDKREPLQVYRSPTNSNIDIGPIKEQINAYLKKDDNYSKGPNMGYISNNNDRMETRTTVKDSMLINISSDRFVDPSIMTQLNNNPLNIKYFS